MMINPISFNSLPERIPKLLLLALFLPLMLAVSYDLLLGKVSDWLYILLLLPCAAVFVWWWGFSMEPVYKIDIRDKNITVYRRNKVVWNCAVSDLRSYEQKRYYRFKVPCLEAWQLILYGKNDQCIINAHPDKWAGEELALLQKILDELL